MRFGGMRGGYGPMRGGYGGYGIMPIGMNGNYSVRDASFRSSRYGMYGGMGMGGMMRRAGMMFDSPYGPRRGAYGMGARGVYGMGGMRRSRSADSFFARGSVVPTRRAL